MKEPELKEAIKLREKFKTLLPFMNSKLESPENSIFEALLQKDLDILTGLLDKL